MSESTPKPGTDAQGFAACADRLKSLFPALFGGAPKPLKLRIQVDIQERAPGQFTKQELSAFFRRFTGSHAYLNAVLRGAHRYDLDGKEAGELSEEHKEVARQELARRRAKQQERVAQEEGERRARFELLRAFESTTLTRANFCALKGIAEGDLDGVLAQAREEAKAWAERPRPQAGRPGGEAARRDRPRDERRGGGGPGGRPRQDARGGQGRGDRRPQTRPEGSGPRAPQKPRQAAHDGAPATPPAAESTPAQDVAKDIPQAD